MRKWIPALLLVAVCGAAVSVVAMSTGVMLVSAGKAIAFIPNEIGKALLHQTPVRPMGASR